MTELLRLPTVSSDSRRRLPPYVSFLRVREALGELQMRGVPPHVGIGTFAAERLSVRAQLAAAFQFLGLIDHRGQPTTQLAGLVASYGTAQWQSTLLSTLQMAYSDLLSSLDASTTPLQFVSLFERFYAGTDDVQRKCRTFFLHAAAEADMGLNPALFSGVKPRGRHHVRGSVSASKALSFQSSAQRPHPECDPQQCEEGRVAEALVRLMNPEKMSPSEMEAVWILIRYLKVRENEIRNKF